MYVNKDSWEDVKKYYAQTFVKFKETGEDIFYIKEVNSSEIVAENIQGEEVGIIVENGYNIDYILPRKTLYQEGSTIVMLSRVPARMWKKGLNKQNTKFETWVGDNWVGQSFSIQRVNGFVNKPGYYQPDTVLSQLGNSVYYGWALNSRMWVCSSGQIYIDKTAIGKINKEKNVILVKPLFESDIREVFKDLVKYKTL
jgi:hypothetical protein